MKTVIFHIEGTHCPSCKILVEDLIKKQDGISDARVDLSKKTVEILGEFEDDQEKNILRFAEILSPYGYNISFEKHSSTKNNNLIKAIFFGTSFLTLFFFLQKSGIVDFGFEGEFTIWTALFIGVIASLSSCLAMVGGLILSLSAKISQSIHQNQNSQDETKHTKQEIRPLVFFHIGRIIGFAIMGGILGLIGQALSINNTVIAILGVIASLIMIILGINLLDIFHFAKKFQITLPKHFFEKIAKTENDSSLFSVNNFFTPFLIGAGTFFLPCGFTQSMQFVALSSGSFITGGLTMLMFSLGTFPMLAVVSFGSFKFSHTKYAPIFFKTVGVIVVGFGIFALLAGMASLGIIRPLFNI